MNQLAGVDTQKFQELQTEMRVEAEKAGTLEFLILSGDQLAYQSADRNDTPEQLK